jgi:hypothetical protein
MAAGSGNVLPVVWAFYFYQLNLVAQMMLELLCGILTTVFIKLNCA